MAKRIAHLEAFNRLVKQLASALVQVYPNDDKVCRIQKRISLAISTAPFELADTAGPYLFEHREAIYAGDSQYFLAAADSAARSAAVASDDAAGYVIQKVVAAWAAMADSAEREDIIGTVQDMLDQYVEYRIHSA